MRTHAALEVRAARSKRLAGYRAILLGLTPSTAHTGKVHFIKPDGARRLGRAYGRRGVDNTPNLEHGRVESVGKFDRYPLLHEFASGARSNGQLRMERCALVDLGYGVRCIGIQPAQTQRLLRHDVLVEAKREQRRTILVFAHVHERGHLSAVR